MKTFGDILKEQRESRGLSQSELAIACHIPVRTLQNHEQGRGEISLADMFAYCQALKINCGVFMKGQPPAEINARPGSQPPSAPGR
ncbi:MAG: helix-turn-helix transcriptional regulator [Gemmatales bacterium]